MKIYVIGGKNNKFLDFGDERQKFLVDEPHTDKNIDFLNPWYCELTGLYHLWMNNNSDPNEIVGLEHYRRYFVNEITKKPLTENEINEILKDNDVICQKFKFGSKTPLTWWGVCLKPYIYYFINNLEDKNFAKWYLNELNTAHEFCRCNMFICKREIMDKYCECLFNTVSKMLPGQFTRRKRIIGFIAEYFMGFWFRYYGYKIAYTKAIEMDKNLKRIIRMSAK